MLEDEIRSLAARVDENSHATRQLAAAVDELARASLAQANSTSMQTQMLREMAKDGIVTREKVDFIHAHTKPRRKLLARLQLLVRGLRYDANKVAGA